MSRLRFDPTAPRQDQEIFHYRFDPERGYVPVEVRPIRVRKEDISPVVDWTAQYLAEIEAERATT
jgi:hypothetical protein